jgi:hypothetical protein
MKMKRNNYKKAFNKMMGDPLKELELVSPKAKKIDTKSPVSLHSKKDVNKLDEIEVTKKSTNYRLKLGKYKIFATVSDKGITLTTMDDHDKFWFCNSTPEMIKNIGALIMEASKIK